jgi:putative ABC transport system substrate-binding protein
MITRRQLLFALTGVLLLGSGWLASAAEVKHFQIGYVGNSTPSGEAGYVEAFERGLREHGYIDGQNITINYRWAEGSNEKVSRIIDEFVQRRVDVIVVTGTFAPLAAKKATSSIPIVFTAGDPLASGIVRSLSKPGGNLTGFSSLDGGIIGKRLELLREFIPGRKRVAVLANPKQPYTRVTIPATQAAAEAQHVSLEFFNASNRVELEVAFAAIAKARPDALLILPDKPFFFTERANILRLVAQLRVPTSYPFPEYAADGGLFFYGANSADFFYRMSGYIDKILKGQNPADLPIEQATRFELLLNLRTAKSLRIKVPQTILLRADRIIE